MKAGILAAGLGSRFLQAGWTEPKPLVRLNGIPLIDHVLGNLFRAGIEGVELLLNERPPADAVAAHVEGSPLGSRLRVWRKTTRSSYESFRFLLERLGEPPFLLSTVDTIFSREELEAFLDVGAYPADCRMVLATTDFVHDERPLWVAVGPGGRIEEIGEGVTERKEVTAGLYLVLGRLPDPAEEDGSFNALRDFLGFLVRRGERVHARRFRLVLDIDRPEDIRLAESVSGGIGAGEDRIESP